jgi:hypothetical protein
MKNHKNKRRLRTEENQTEQIRVWHREIVTRILTKELEKLRVKK